MIWAPEDHWPGREERTADASYRTRLTGSPGLATSRRTAGWNHAAAGFFALRSRRSGRAAGGRAAQAAGGSVAFCARRRRVERRSRHRRDRGDLQHRRRGALSHHARDHTLNNEIFYDDFKTKIKNLESHFEQMNDFVQNLSLSDKSNKEFLEQNRAYVTLVKKQISETEQQLTANTAMLQQMDERWEQLIKSYETKLQIHEQGLKNILVVREEALINKLTQQQDNWILKQYENDELHKADMMQQHEKIVALLREQRKQNEEILEYISTNISSKQDLVRMEKKNPIKMNLLLCIVAIEAILIGVQFFL